MTPTYKNKKEREALRRRKNKHSKATALPCKKCALSFCLRDSALARFAPSAPFRDSPEFPARLVLSDIRIPESITPSADVLRHFPDRVKRVFNSIPYYYSTHSPLLSTYFYKFSQYFCNNLNLHFPYKRTDVRENYGHPLFLFFDKRIRTIR